MSLHQHRLEVEGAWVDQEEKEGEVDAGGERPVLRDTVTRIRNLLVSSSVLVWGVKLTLAWKGAWWSLCSSWLALQIPMPETRGGCWAPPMQGRTGGPPVARRGDKEYLALSADASKTGDYWSKTLGCWTWKGYMPAQRQKRNFMWVTAPAASGMWGLPRQRRGTRVSVAKPSSPAAFPFSCSPSCMWVHRRLPHCLPGCLSWPFLRFLLCLFVFVYFFILVHHPGSKIKRSDSSSSISSQSPIGWLLSFVPLTHTPAHWEWLCFLNCGASWLCGICCLYKCFE